MGRQYAFYNFLIFISIFDSRKIKNTTEADKKYVRVNNRKNHKDRNIVNFVLNHKKGRKNNL